MSIIKQKCTHKLRVTEHVQNKCKTDSGNCLHKEHRGLSTEINLNSLSFKYGVLFNIYTEKIVMMTKSWLLVGADIPCSNRHL